MLVASERYTLRVRVRFVGFVMTDSVSSMLVDVEVKVHLNGLLRVHRAILDI
jgi:hypothetical protein